MSEFSHFFYQYFLKLGLTDLAAKYLNMAVLLLIMLIVIIIVDLVIRKVLLNLFTKLSETILIPRII